MLRTVADQPSLWDAILPEELRRLPTELARVDDLLDDRVLFTPFVPFFDPRMGRPSTPMETYLRLMYLKFRYRLGFESLCREVSDSITWRQFCRIGIDQPVPHPTTLMKLTSRCGSTAIEGLNEALIAKAVDANWSGPRRSASTPRWSRRMSPIRPIPGCWPRQSSGSPTSAAESTPPGVRCGPRSVTGPGPPDDGRTT